MTARSRLNPELLVSTPFRLAATSVAVFLCAAAAIVGVLFWQTNEALTEQVLANLNAEVAELTATAKQGGVDLVAQTVMARSRAQGPGLYFLSDLSGRKIAGNLSRRPPELDDSDKGGVFHYEFGPPGQVRSRLGVAIPVPVGEGARLIVGRDVEDQRNFAERIKRAFLFSFVLLALIGLAGGLGAGRLLLRRIDTINAASKKIMAGDLSRRIPLEGSGDELDDLANNLNAMLDRIEQLMTGLREVSENIAHDLKTPLNRMRNRAEQALRDPRGSEAFRDGLERTIEEADELIKTFNALLLIAKLEAGAQDESRETFDLGAFVRELAELYEPVAEEAGLELRIEAPDGPLLRANRQLIGQAIANLIDNAVKYGAAVVEGAPAMIEVCVTAKPGFAEVGVADRGAGIRPEDRARVLRRFVRLEESRTRPGTGLGLSLVAAVARLHGGAIRLEDNEPGLRAVLTLSLGSEAAARA